jgi:hypothetical protein
LATAALYSSRNSEQLSPRLTLRRQLGESYNSSFICVRAARGDFSAVLGSAVAVSATAPAKRISVFITCAAASKFSISSVTAAATPVLYLHLFSKQKSFVISIGSGKRFSCNVGFSGSLVSSSLVSSSLVSSSLVSSSLVSSSLVGNSLVSTPTDSFSFSGSLDGSLLFGDISLAGSFSLSGNLGSSFLSSDLSLAGNFSFSSSLASSSLSSDVSLSCDLGLAGSTSFIDSAVRNNSSCRFFSATALLSHFAHVQQQSLELQC